MIGQIASQHLVPAAARRVAELLRNDRLADGQASGRRTLAEIAYWADEIKDTPWGKRLGSWHFDDIPVCGVADPSRYCKRGNCASAQLAQHAQILGDERASARRRNEALKWVVHLVGDIHQPLHAADRHDQGGNLVEVSFFGERDNPPYGTIKLHTIWDIHMVRRLISEKRGEHAIVSAPISDAQKAQWEQGSVADWMNESHHAAKAAVYSIIPQKYSCSGKIKDVLAVDQAYFSSSAPLIEGQIRKAGIRLARILNEILGR